MYTGAIALAWGCDCHALRSGLTSSCRATERSFLETLTCGLGVESGAGIRRVGRRFEEETHLTPDDHPRDAP